MKAHILATAALAALVAGCTTAPAGDIAPVTLVGPLCTSIDRLALDVELPQVRIGDTLCIAASGAYGLTASPTQFISHPYPREIVLQDGTLSEATEPLRYHRYDQSEA